MERHCKWRGEERCVFAMRRGATQGSQNRSAAASEVDKRKVYKGSKRDRGSRAASTDRKALQEMQTETHGVQGL